MKIFRKLFPKKYDLYAIGNALVDMEFEVDDNFLKKLGITKGHMMLIDEKRHDEIIREIQSLPVHRHCGGSAANTVIGHAHLGGKTFYSCKVAKDEHGIFYKKDLKSNRVATNPI